MIKKIDKLRLMYLLAIYIIIKWEWKKLIYLQHEIYYLYSLKINNFTKMSKTTD